MGIVKGRNVYIAGTAVLLGSVKLSDGVSIFDHSVLRGDMNTILIGENSNVQDNVTIHTEMDHEVIVGSNVSIGHNAVIHGCTIGDNVIIGIGAIVLNGAKIGSGSVIGAGSVVTEDFEAPENSLVLGLPGKVKKIDKAYRSYAIRNGESYQELRDKYLRKDIDREMG